MLTAICIDRLSATRTASLALLILLCVCLSATGATAPGVVITPDRAKALFGARQAKLVTYSAAQKGREGARPIYLIDFNQSPCRAEQIVEDFHWAFDKGYSDPFISPDGTRLVYGNVNREVVVCELKPGGPGRTVVVREGYDARWWVHPKTGEEYIIYSDVPSTRNAQIEGYGSGTLVQKIRKGTCQPQDARKVLLPGFRMVEGRSPSGKYIFGITPGFALAELTDPLAVENAAIRTLWSGGPGSICNGGIVHDESEGARCLWEDKQHMVVHYGTPYPTAGGGKQVDEKLPRPADDQVPAGFKLGNVLAPEWSTDPDYMTAGWALVDGRQEIRTPWVYRKSSRAWTQVADSGWHSHLWLEPQGNPRSVSEPAGSPPRPIRQTPASQPAFWSTQARGAVLWTTGDPQNPSKACKEDGQPLYRTGHAFTLKGLALYGRQGSMRLAGGYFLDAASGRHLAQVCNTSQEMTIAAVLRPNSASQRGVIAAFGPAGKHNALLRQEDARLVLEVRTASGSARRVDLCDVPATGPIHLVAICRSGEVQWYANGHKGAGAAIDASGRWAWVEGPITFGADADGLSPWHGTIERAAIYSKGLSNVEARADHAAYLAWVKSWQAVETIRVDARLIKASPLTALDGQAYDRAYAVHQYEIVKVTGGSITPGRLHVAQWVWADRVRLHASRLEPGRVYPLVLEPMTAHGEFEREFVFDAAVKDDGIAPIYADVGPIIRVSPDTIGTQPSQDDRPQ